MIQIRPFRPQDQAAVRRLILAGLAEHWGTLDPNLNPDLDDIAASYAGQTVLVAHKSGQIVGTGALIEEAPGVGRIVRMSVEGRMRRWGIGRILLRQLIAAARQRGFSKVVLETTSSWTGAIAFYLASGFRIIGEWEGDTHFELDL